MLIKSCFSCKFHEAKKDGKELNSYCQRENCWSRYSRCVSLKALDTYLEQQSSNIDRRTVMEKNANPA
jgi:hypothetical protein